MCILQYSFPQFKLYGSNSYIDMLSIGEKIDCTKAGLIASSFEYGIEAFYRPIPLQTIQSCLHGQDVPGSVCQR